jgi:hypothetical protein
MIRVLLCAFLALAPIGGALAQASDSAALAAQRAIAQQHVDRINLLVVELANAGNLMPKIAPAEANDAVAGRAAFTRELARIKTSRPELDRIRERIDALPQLQPTGVADIDGTSSFLTTEARKYLADYAAILAEFETLFTASLAGDAPTAARSAAKGRRAAIVLIQTSAVALRALKVVSVAGDSVEAAKIEAVALVVDGNVALMRARMDDMSQVDAGRALLEAAKSIRQQLPLARSIIQNDARTFGDPPIGGVPEFVRIYRIEWRMLELAEQFAGIVEAAASQLASGKMAKADVDSVYAQSNGLMKEIIALSKESKVSLR